MLPQRLAFIDLETTGLNAIRDRIIEIGIVLVEDGKVLQTFESLINPQIFISSQIEQITGITRESLIRAPVFEDVMHTVLDLLSDAVFVAHNVRFDYSFLRSEYKRFNISFSSPHFCTAKLSRKLFPTHARHNLDSIIERFGFVCQRRHRALDDAKVLWDFYQEAQNRFSSEKLEDTVKQLLGKPTLPPLLDPNKINSLPQTAGVYIFYGASGAPLYVGKSKNIRNRVLSHFSSDHRVAKELTMCQQIADIEVISTAGELGALIKEATLIKKLQPIYNRVLRVGRKLTMLSESVRDGYKTVFMQTVTLLTPEMLSTCIGIFKSKKQAQAFLTQAVKAYALCEKLVGLENTRGACFPYRLGACKGACVKEESPLFYNIRFMDAFYQYKIKSWPFPGAIRLVEKDPIEEREEEFIIDKWCLLESRSEKEYIFDLDTYKILLKFLQRPEYQRAVSPVTFNQDY